MAGHPCDPGRMPVHSVHDRSLLARLLGRDPARYAYQLGDLDDFFWPYTTWYRHRDTLALLYHGGLPPTLLAFAEPGRDSELTELLTGLIPLLPRRFHAHLSPGAETALAGAFRTRPHGRHRKLALTDRARLDRVPPAGTVLTGDDLPQLHELYRVAYPDNWFDPRMLETGHYLGIHREGRLLAVAGVHVGSPRSATSPPTRRYGVRGWPPRWSPRCAGGCWPASTTSRSTCTRRTPRR